MTPEQRQFILKNYQRLSSRQIAKQLDLPRTEIEKSIHELKHQPIATLEAEEPISRKKELLILAGLFAAALFVRFLYLYWLKTTPFFAPLSKTLDDGVYNLMAQEISRGNWIGRVPFSAYRIPLYPYFLAVLYHFFGYSLLVVHAVQSFLGAFTPVLIYLISRETFKNTRTAVISGLLACFYMPFIFYENLLLGESLSIALSLLGVLLLMTGLGRERKSTPRIILSGFVFGVSILLRPNLLIPAGFLAAYIYYDHGFKSKAHLRGLALSAAFLTAIVIAVIPVTLKNYYLHKDFLPLSAVGGVNFYIGNNPEATGKFHLTKGIGSELDEMIKNSEMIAQKEMGRLLKPSEVSSFWTRKAMAHAFSSPGSYLGLLAKKTGLFLNRYEFPDILDIRFVAQFIPFLAMNPFGYGVLMVLAVFGILSSWRNKNHAALLPGIFLVGYAFSVILFFVTARYRLPAAPFLILFASLAIHQLIEAARLWKATELLKFAGVCVAAGVVVFWPVERTSFGTNYNSLGVALKNQGRLEEAEKYYRKAIELEPLYPSPYYNMGLLLNKLGRRGEAAQYYQKYEEAKKKLT